MYNTQTTHLKFIVRGFKLPAQKQNYIVVWKDQYFISGFFSKFSVHKKGWMFEILSEHFNIFVAGTGYTAVSTTNAVA